MYPVPFVRTLCPADTQITVKETFRTRFGLFIEIEYQLPVIGVHVRKHTDNIRQRRVMAFTQIPVPLADGVSGVIQQVDFRISHLGIVGNNREEVLKVMHFAQCIIAFGIIYIHQQIVRQIPFRIIEHQAPHIKIGHPLPFRPEEPAFFVEVIMQMKTAGTAGLKAFKHILSHIGALKQAQADDPVLVCYSEYLEVPVIAVQQHALLII